MTARGESLPELTLLCHWAAVTTPPICSAYSASRRALITNDVLPPSPLSRIAGKHAAGRMGAGIAAPWPMPVAAVMTAARARHREPGTRQGAVCAAIGLGCIVGTVIEPVTRRPRLWSPATRLAIGVNLATSAALIGAGVWHAAPARRQHRER